MGVNRFMSPQKTQYFQTYVDQYVPLPFEAMVMAMDTKQKTYDEVKANGDAILSAHSDALGVDVPQRDAIYKEYDRRVDEAVNNVGGDYSLLRNEIYNIAKDLKQDMTMGALGRMQTYHDAYLKDNEAIDKSNMPESMKNALKNQNYQKYAEVGGDVKGAIYSGRLGIDYQNLAELQRKYAKDVEADMTKRGWYSKPTADGKGNIWYDQTGKEIEKKDIEKIKSHVFNMMSSDQKVLDQLSLEADLLYGGDPNYVENTLNFMAEDAGRAFSYKKDTYTQDLKHIDDWLFRTDYGSGAAKAAKGQVNLLESTSTNRNLTYDTVNNSLKNATQTLRDAQVKLNAASAPMKDRPLTSSESVAVIRAQEELKDAQFKYDMAKNNLDQFAGEGTKWGNKQEVIKEFTRVGLFKDMLNMESLPIGFNDFHNISDNELVSLIYDLDKKGSSPEEIKEYLAENIPLNANGMNQGIFSPNTKLNATVDNFMRMKENTVGKTIKEKPLTKTSTIMVGSPETDLYDYSRALGDKIQTGEASFILQNGMVSSEDAFQNLIRGKEINVSPNLDFEGGRIAFTLNYRDKGEDMSTGQNITGYLSSSSKHSADHIGLELINMGQHKKDLTPQLRDRYINAGKAVLASPLIGDNLKEANINNLRIGNEAKGITDEYGNSFDIKKVGDSSFQIKKSEDPIYKIQDLRSEQDLLVRYYDLISQ